MEQLDKIIEVVEEKCKYKNLYELTKKIADVLQEELIKQKESFAKYYIKEYMVISDDDEHKHISKYNREYFRENGGDVDVLVEVARKMYQEKVKEYEGQQSESIDETD